MTIFKLTAQPRNDSEWFLIYRLGMNTGAVMQALTFLHRLNPEAAKEMRINVLVTLREQDLETQDSAAPSPDGR